MIKSAGITQGERQLLGPQTTGRDYRYLSIPEHAIRTEVDVAVPMRDGARLRADIHRPSVSRATPALLAISAYPRQLQYLGIPAGFVEAGQTDFWVPRGYAHVIANVRGTSGSEGEYGLFAPIEGRDLHDLIEWIAAQPWCDGNVGMIGVSYFAIEQIRAALEAPPHLKAIFPWSATVDFYREVMWHGGMPSRFMGGYFNGIGVVDKQPADFFRGTFFKALNKLLLRPGVHRRFETPLADTLAAFDKASAFAYDAHPWDDLFYRTAVEHQLCDDYWQERDVTDRLGEIRIPMYLGADWDNVGMHLHTPFLALERLGKDVPFRVGMAPRGGLQWPWESLHVEALAWYDHWLKGRDTGILEGPPIRYFVEGAGEWREASSWPLPETRFVDLHLGADGSLGGSAEGERSYLFLPPGLRRPRNANPPPLPGSLSWDTAPFAEAVDLVGPFTLHLEASSTATDTDWIVKLSDVGPDGTARDLTQGWLRASHRAIDPARSKAYRPEHPHDRAEPLVPRAATSFAIAVLPTAHRFAAGHRLRIAITSNDGDGFAMQGLSHEPLGMLARNTVLAHSRLVVPLVAGRLPG